MAEQTRPPIVTILGHVDHGKCVSGDTLIPLPSGQIMKAKDIFEAYSKNLTPDILPDGVRFNLKTFLKIFSFDGKDIVIKHITHLWKLNASEKLIEVTLYSGDKIKVTPEHPFYIFNSEGKIIQKRADELVNAEFIICPKDLPTEFTNLKTIKKEIIQKLMSTDGWVVFLDNEESKRFWDKTSNHRICDLIAKNLFSTDARGQFQKKRFRILDYIKLGSFLGFNKSELYDFIGAIKNANNDIGWHTSKRIQLPKTTKAFSNLGYILGCFVGDGSFDRNNVYLHNNDSEIIKNYRNYIEEIFGVETKAVTAHTCLLTKNSAGKSLLRFINEIFEIPNKQKSANVQIPQLVQRYEPLLKEFIAGYFDTDGYVSQINYCAEFTSKSAQLINQLGIVLLSFGIHSVIYQKNGFSYLRIANKPYLENFLKKFNFRLLSKKNKMQAILSQSSVSRIFDYTPLTSKILSDIKTSNRLVPYWDTYKKTSGELTRPFLKNLITLNKLTFKNDMKAVLNTTVSPIKVRKIEIVDAKEEFVYDFTVEDTHNFVAERIVIHNTTLLDFIRKASVAAHEHGGITQAIGAYQAEHGGKLITFIDTPGHAAFEKMRSRGAKVADIAVLVVAADDGVMPQTVEAIKHILAAKVSLIVAVNKIDIPGLNLSAQMEKIKRQLSDNKVLVEEYGGDVPIVQLSAKTGDGVDKLLEMILLVAEVTEIKGDPSLSAQGVVIESNLDKSKGPVATVIIRNGTLKKTDLIVLGGVRSKIRGILDYTSKAVDSAGPSTPVELLGLEVVPAVGAVLGEAAEVVAKAQVLSLVDKLRQEGDSEKLNVIAKADKAGSLEAIEDALNQFNVDKETVKLVSKGTGDITEKDVELAATTKAFIVGFNVKVSPAASKIVETEHVLVRTYTIIYELLDELKEVVEGILAGELSEEIFGVAQIVAEFQYGKDQRIAGCKVLDGSISKGPKVRVVRGDPSAGSGQGEIVGEGKAKSIKHLKEEVAKVEKGQECGILFDPPIDFLVGDIVQSYRKL